MMPRIQRRCSQLWMLSALAAIFLASVAPTASGTEARGSWLERIYALGNAKLDIDEVDDYRVDATVAVIDSGVDLQNPDLNIAGALDCTAASGASTPPYQCDQSPGAGDDSAAGFWHGTFTAEGLAALDNGLNSDLAVGVGIAPGARVWGIRAVDESFWETLTGPSEEAFQWSLDSSIAAFKWIAKTRTDANPANDIDVAVGGPGNLCSRTPQPRAYPLCSNTAEIEEHDDAIAAMVDAGVVYVIAGSNGNYDAADIVGASHPDAIAVSAMADLDGLAGGLAEEEACPRPPHDPNPPSSGLDADDTLSSGSNWGAVLDITAPGCVTTSSQHQVAAAAAILASISHPDSRSDVEAIRETLLRAGNHDWIDDGGSEGKGDGNHEPLLDLGCEAIFAPAMVAGTQSGSIAPPSNPDAESDVDCDGRSDLVTLRPDGTALVHPGKADGKFGSGITSFAGSPLDVAQYDGTGHYAIDVADVDGDGPADLITLSDEGDLHVFAGNHDKSFEEQAATSELGLTPALLEAGGHEPIAVADVDGDGHGDLVSYDDKADAIMVYRGKADASFEAGVVARSGVASALHTGTGHYFLDAADVTGDGLADLVSMTSGGDLDVFAGQSGATFAAPTASHTGSIDPAMDDGAGYEPAGLGDSTGDGRADLVLLDNQTDTLRLYPGAANGSFGTAVKAWPSAVTSTTFPGEPSGHHFAGVFDVDGDGHSDLTGLITGYAYTVGGLANGTFAELALSFDGTFASTQHGQTASTKHEMVAEKPSWKRRGCKAGGCGWAIEATPNVSEVKNNRLTAVSCTSPTSCFATANLVAWGNSWAYGAVWDGKTWEPRGGVGENEGTELVDVSCTSPTFCMTVGSQTKANGDVLTLAVRWNGTGWTRLETPNVSEVKNNRLTAVSCTSPTSCFATATLFALGKSWAYGAVWDGKTWEPRGGVGENEGTEFADVSCASATSCMAVGSQTKANGDVSTLAVRWNGTGWTRHNPAAVGEVKNNRLTAVSCTSQTFCLATGNMVDLGTAWTYGESWNGSAWTHRGGFPENGGTELSDVSCTSATSCTAVGNQIEANGDVLTLAGHWNATNWSRQETPNVTGADNRLAGVSCLFPGCSAVGSYVDGEGGVSTLALRVP